MGCPSTETKENNEAQENEGVVRNFFLGGVTEVLLLLDTSLEIEKRGLLIVPIDDSRAKSVHL